MRFSFEILEDISQAPDSDAVMETNQVLDLLGITDDESFESAMERLFDVALHPNIIALSDKDRLAAIKTCQIIIGRYFLSLLEDPASD